MAKIFINLKTGWHFWFSKPKHRGLIIDDIIRILRYVKKNYEHVGKPKVEFTRYEVQNLVQWILYKTKLNPFDVYRVSRTAKQRTFWKHYTYGFFGGTGAHAARLAGYRHPKQRAWELAHNYSRKKYKQHKIIIK